METGETRRKRKKEKGKKVLKLGIEPKTFALLARRSNQLSYSSSEGEQIVYYKKMITIHSLVHFIQSIFSSSTLDVNKHYKPHLSHRFLKDSTLDASPFLRP